MSTVTAGRLPKTNEISTHRDTGTAEPNQILQVVAAANVCGAGMDPDDLKTLDGHTPDEFLPPDRCS